MTRNQSMIESRRIKIKGKHIQAISIRVINKNLILLVGNKGFVMCGYLNLQAAEKFKDVAVKIVGVSSINEALQAKVHSLSSGAKRLGIRKGQPIRQVLPLIA